MLRLHRRPVKENRRHARSIKAREQTIHHDHQVKLFTAIEVLGLLASQTLIEFRVIGTERREIPIGAEHSVVVGKRFCHFLLISSCSVFVFANRVGNGKLGKVRKDFSDLFINLAVGLELFEETVVALCLLNRGNRQEPFMRIAVACVEAQFAAAAVDYVVDDFVAMVV